MTRRKILNLFLVLAGILVGTFVGTLCQNINGLSWLAYGIDFGMAAPLELNLGVMQLTFGVSIELTFAVIIFVILSLIIGKVISK